MIRFEDVYRIVGRYYPDADLDVLRRAYIFSAREHKDQMRQSGEPYLIHPLSVAGILAEMKMDVPTVSTGFLHDVVEDTLTTTETIREYFGEEIAQLVDGVTKISNLGKVSKEEQQAESIRKMVLAMVKDLRVVIVKLADRLHNMRTLSHLPPEKRRRIAQETLDVYAPIAHRLGMGKIRAELEDLSFKFLEPDAYKKLQDAVERRRSASDSFLEELKARITKYLQEAGVELVRLEGRTKRLYSIYLKMKRQKITLDQVYDLMAIRLITKEMRDCYAALGVIHQHWHPVPGRIKDFIATPRENLYQSLHTSVVGDEGQPFEVQIRTEDMHRVAEEGIAAHWKYKEGKLNDTSEDETFKWLRHLVEWQQEVPDSREFMDGLKLDLYPKEVYAFTPKGKVIELPRGATPVDFAYAIHTEVGNQCTGAKVNGRIVPLKYLLRNGEVVEIMTTPGHHPSRDWLNFVATARARNKIKHWLTEQQRAKSVELGRKLFEKEASRLQLKAKKIFDDEQLPRILSEHGYHKIEDMLAAVGYGKIAPRTILVRFVPPEKLADLEDRKPSRLQKVGEVVRRALRLGEDRVSVKGIDDVMVYRARCCSPIRGEPVVGYITQGKGVAVHARRCKNAANLMINRERIVDVDWVGADGTTSSNYAVKLAVTTEDRQGMLADLTLAISGIKTNIRDVHTEVFDNGSARIDVVVDIADLKHLERVISAIKGVVGVLDVERTGTQAQSSGT
jgi:GTP pyrophosphokinase